MNRGLIRFSRVALAGALGAVISTLQSEPYWLVVGPVLNGIGKYLREKYNWSWLPF